MKKVKTWMKILDIAFDFKDRVNASLGRETSAEWNKRMLKEHFEYLMSLNLQGLHEVLDEIRDIWKSGLYEGFMSSFEERKIISRPLTFKELANNKLATLATANLPVTSLKTISLSKTDLNVFRSMRPLIETTYYLNSGCPFSWDDSLNIAFSGLDARLLSALDRFDQVEEVPELTAEFFQKLGKTQIFDKKTSDFYLTITRLLVDIENEIFGMRFRDFNSDYVPTEGLFIQLLAGCNAVHHNREHIIEEDIVKAYKTFFKLMKTNVTQYKAIHELVQDMDENNPDYSSVLICKSCGDYYKLELDESVDDFESCHCGGELKYLHYEDNE
ncbi:hypothetical protein [Methanobacterium oryzae]|uniref:hypothetical protein n=1 Tax=Methanobacterium oryzae TaxID=69540 RepID=UPI003D19F78D